MRLTAAVLAAAVGTVPVALAAVSVPGLLRTDVRAAAGRQGCRGRPPRRALVESGQLPGVVAEVIIDHVAAGDGPERFGGSARVDFG